MAQLQSEDTQAVDLLLDRTPAVAGNDKAVVFGGAATGRMQGVQRLLHLLDLLQPEDPPADLVSRTLRRVNEAVAENPAALHGDLVSVNRPTM
jgi:hypothetical protein